VSICPPAYKIDLIVGWYVINAPFLRLLFLVSQRVLGQCLGVVEDEDRL
jgi:hypothetical protein